MSKTNKSYQIKSLELELDEPKMAYGEMKISSLLILVGANGTGKSLVLKIIWFMAMVAFDRARIKEFKMSPEVFANVVQFTLDNTFHKQSFSGRFLAKFEGEFSIEVKVKMGMIIDMKFVGFDEDVIDGFNIPKYLSSNMRLFDAIGHYLQFRKVLNGTNRELSESSMQKLLESYRLYDLMYIEGLITKCPISIRPELNEKLVDYDFTKEMDKFDVDLDLCDFFISGPDLYQECKTLGAGHQAIINMFVGTGS